MSTAIDVLAPVIRLAGSPLAANWLNDLVSVRVERALGLIGRATLRFSDPGYALSASDTFALGKQVQIAEPDKDELLCGTVTGVSLEQSSTAHPELVVVVDDAGYKLTRGTHVTTYLDSTYADVIGKIASQNGLSTQVQATSDVNGYLLQAGTDLAFLNTIVERIGYVWWIEGPSTLVARRVVPGSPVAALTLGEGLTDFSVRASGLRPTGLTVKGWDPDSQNDVVGTSPAPSSGATPAFLTSYVGTEPEAGLSSAKASFAEWSPVGQGEAETMAGALYGDWAAGAVVARGSCDISSAIKPGSTITVKNVGPASGNYLVTEVEHVFSHRGFFTRFTAGPRRPANLVDTLGTPPPDPGFAAAGMVVGVVTNNVESENLGAGRVKVRYTGIDGQIESPWARVVTLGGGAKRGVVFQPEVGDEVLVGFEHGDTRRPVVIGGLFSKKNVLPTAGSGVANGAVDFRRITSRKNHIIEFADGAALADQHIMLKLGTAEHRLRLGADRFDIEVAAGKPLTIKAGSAKFDISNSGDVTIEGANITIKATAALNLEGMQTTMKASTAASVQGATVEVKGQATTSVEASGPLALKGAIVQIN